MMAGVSAKLPLHTRASSKAPREVTICALFTAMLVMVPALLASRRDPAEFRLPPGDAGLWRSLTRNDGRYYAAIAERGYVHDPARPSDAAFFPGYPLVCRFVSLLLGLPVDVSLAAVSNGCLLMAAWQFQRYACARFEGLNEQRAAAAASSLAFLFVPTGLFLRCGYSEALFGLCLVLFLSRGGRLAGDLPAALLAGFATAVRPTGIALSAAFVATQWGDLRPLWQGGWVNRAAAFGQRAALCLVSVWGIAAFAGYLGIRSGDCLAFLHAQDGWAARPLPGPAREFWALMVLEPLWSVYDPGSEAYWRRYCTAGSAWLSLQFANPLAFAATTLLVLYGTIKRWLTFPEVVVSAALLGIPYVTHAWQSAMSAHGRYASVVLPAYLVLGRVLGRWGARWRLAAAGLGAAGLAAYSWQFARGGRIM
jgi:hypothetical protein